MTETPATYPVSTSLPPFVRLESTNGVAVVTLDRAERHNALVPELLTGLLDALNSGLARAGRALVLRAEGRSFSTGGDLTGFLQHRDRIGAYADRLVGLLNDCILALYTLPCPIVVAVQGQVTGGSLGLLLACDRVILHRSVTITPHYTVVGFSPDGGWTALLPQRIGHPATADWLHANATHDADTCRDLGLAQDIVDGDVTAAALDWVGSLPGSRPGASRRIRSLLNADVAALRARLDAERTAFVEQIQTDEALVGISRFMEQRPHA